MACKEMDVNQVQGWKRGAECDAIDLPHNPIRMSQITMRYSPNRSYTLHLLCSGNCFSKILCSSSVAKYILSFLTISTLEPAHSSLLYATTPNSLSNKGSLALMTSAARKYSSARLVAESCRCSIPMNKRGKCDLNDPCQHDFALT